MGDISSFVGGPSGSMPHESFTDMLSRMDASPENGRQLSTSPGRPAKKVQKTSSGDNDVAQAHQRASESGAPRAQSNTHPSGPPYICPTCLTSYSRLEYLRRHERRHADIRPFVCDCGKGFSRSDVLSRHKRQCRVHLQNEGVDDSGSMDVDSKGSKGGGQRKQGAAKPGRPKGSSNGGESSSKQKKARAEPGNRSLGDYLLDPALQNASMSRVEMEGDPSLAARPPHPAYMQAAPPVDNQLSALGQFATQQQYPPSSPESSGSLTSRSEHSCPRYGNREVARHGSNASSSKSSLRNSSLDFYNGAGPSARAPGRRPADEAGLWEGIDSSRLPSPGTGSGGSSRSGSNVASYPMAPGFPSGASPMFYPERAGSRGSTFNAGPDPSYMRSNVAGSSGVGVGAGVGAGVGLAGYSPTTSTGPAFSFPASDSGTSSSTSSFTAAGRGALHEPLTFTECEPVRYSVTAGAPSPFSNTAMTSSVSPYLSAFSNERDTPLVPSPRVLTTPSSSTPYEAMPWNMRPPLKPMSRNHASSPGHVQSDRMPSERTGEAAGQEHRGEPSHHASTSTPSSTQSHASASTAAIALANGFAGGEGTQTPSRFVTTGAADPNSGSYLDQFSAGPEAFLLRVQGGSQEMRAGISSDGPASALGSAPFSSSHGNTLMWDQAFGDGQPNSALGWLNSPSIQQLPQGSGSNTFSPARDTQGRGSYFPTMKMSEEGVDSSQSLDFPIGALALEKALSDVKNPFYIPPHLFRSCYAITHWNLPPLKRLSMLALHSQQNLLKHFPILHEPTFRIDTTPGCLAFAMCMLGGHEAGRKWWAGEEVVPKSSKQVLGEAVWGCSNPPSCAQQVEGSDRFTNVDEEDGQELVKPVVMSEKMDMLQRSFASRCKSSKDKVSVVQALMLSQSNNFLSSDPLTRTIAAISHGSVVNMARQAGFFNPNADHVRRQVAYTPEEVLSSTIFEAGDLCFSYSFLPTYLPGCPDEEKIWRRWADFEGRRRTAFLIFTMDTVASLDSSIPALLSLEEMRHLPLPSPDLIWRAPTASAWRIALETYAGPSFDEAMQQIFGDEDAIQFPEQTGAGPSIRGSHGPFARLVMMIALLRGIISMVEGRTQKVSRPSPVERWIWLPSGYSEEDRHLAVYKRALERWREAWDFDPLCKHVSGPLSGSHGSEHNSAHSGSPITGTFENVNGSSSSHMPNHGGKVFSSATASGATPLCDDALPFYWLAHVLLGHAASGKGIPRRSGGAESASGSAPGMENFGAESVREAGAGTGNIPDFRSMLRFAKQFVNAGEGAATAAANANANANPDVYGMAG